MGFELFLWWKLYLILTQHVSWEPRWSEPWELCYLFGDGWELYLFANGWNPLNLLLSNVIIAIIYFTILYCGPCLQNYGMIGVLCYDRKKNSFLILKDKVSPSYIKQDVVIIYKVTGEKNGASAFLYYFSTCCLFCSKQRINHNQWWFISTSTGRRSTPSWSPWRAGKLC